LRRTVQVLKFVAPFVAPGIGLADGVMAKDLKFDLQMMEKIAANFPEINIDSDPELAGRGKESRMEGADMRKLQAWLEEKDTPRHFQSLIRVLTPEGHYLWLCPHHAAEFK
jgi:internalin A